MPIKKYRVDTDQGSYEIEVEEPGQAPAVMVNGQPMSIEDYNRTQQTPDRSMLDTAKDVAIGAMKGAGNTAYGLGKIVHDYTPIGRISDVIQPHAFEPQNKPPELTPTNTPQKVGYGVEQVGEFFAPVGVAGKIGKAAEVAKAAGLTLAQTGSPTAAGVSGGLTAVLPGAGAAARAAGALETSANKSMAQALGATKEWAKSEAAKLAPQMLQRGIGGSRSVMLELAKKTATRVGDELERAYTLATQAGQTVPANIIQGNIQLAGDVLKVVGPSGTRVVVPGTERVITKLDELAAFVGQMGPDIPVDKAAALKRTWDTIVSKAGLYGPKAQASATDSADAWAYREAAGAFRDLLNANPTIGALNQELAFWTGLKKVLKETEKRTQAQRGSITDAIRGTGGAVTGAVMGGPVGAGVGQLVTQHLSRVLASPAWRSMVSGPLKQQLADALASGSMGHVLSVTSRILASAPARLVD